ncbi:MAG: hypothetical protein FWC20_03240 [Oscillospiraceae bacterium]|nr:hypothetical protein [Oscillospiraceae bacterium]MCL2278407.1 hypothetical protein [Oscillospiraceae bacterium]
MEAVRQVIDSTQLNGIIPLPKKFENKKVEIVVSLADRRTSKTHQRKSLRGCLSKYANPELSHMEKDAWAESVREKYANS